MPFLQFNNHQIEAVFETCTSFQNGYILRGRNVALHTQDKYRSYYTHGWQSWSLAAWTDLQKLPESRPRLLNPLQIDPVYALHPFPNGSWLGAVDYENGNVMLLGGLGLDSHVQLCGGILQGWFEDYKNSLSSQEWFVGFGNELEVFNNYASELGHRFGFKQLNEAQKVWCSWYSLGTSIDEQTMGKVITGLSSLPFNVVQIDDGWQIAIGDWQANHKFSSGMKQLADRINSTGRKAGLWLAPFLVAPSSRTFHDHPDWLLRDDQGKLVSAGFNWGELLFALDTTHPMALDWLANLMKQVRLWGYDYVKLDFLYAGALPGARHTNISREQAYRNALSVIREALGQDAFLLVCGAPIIPSLGLCEAIRVGPDVAEYWEKYIDAVLLYNPAIPGTRNGIRTTINRLWLEPLVQIDPDVTYFRTKFLKLTDIQKALLQDLSLICNYKASSDPPQLLTQKENETLHNFLAKQPEIKRTGRYTFLIGQRQVDFSIAALLPKPIHGVGYLLRMIASCLGNQPLTLILLEKLQDLAVKKIKNIIR